MKKLSAILFLSLLFSASAFSQGIIIPQSTAKISLNYIAGSINNTSYLVEPTGPTIYGDNYYSVTPQYQSYDLPTGTSNLTKFSRSFATFSCQSGGLSTNLSLSPVGSVPSSMTTLTYQVLSYAIPSGGNFQLSESDFNKGRVVAEFGMPTNYSNEPYTPPVIDVTSSFYRLCQGTGNVGLGIVVRLKNDLLMPQTYPGSNNMVIAFAAQVSGQ